MKFTFVLTRILFAVLLVYHFPATAGTPYTIVLRQDPESGRDAWMDSRGPDVTHPDNWDVVIAAWTNGGEPLTLRSLIWFDLSKIPANTRINTAKLNLYGMVSPSEGPTSNLSGDNSFSLYRVTDSWNPNSVTWNTMPSYDASSAVYVDGGSTTYSVKNLDVTAMVKAMVSSGKYGFLAKLNTEEYYRRVVFGSSRNPDSTLRPQLILELEDTSSSGILPVMAEKENVSIYPNPSAGIFTFETSSADAFDLTVCDLMGKIISSKASVHSGDKLDLTMYRKGVYFIHIRKQAGGTTQVARVIIQ